MSDFAKANIAGWGINDKLTSAQMNTLDLDHTNSLNRTGGNITGDVHVNTGAVITTDSGGIIDVLSGGVLKLRGGSSTIIGASAAVSNGGVISNIFAGHTDLRIIDGSDADMLTLGINSADIIVLPTLTGNHTYKLLATGAAEGSQILVTTDYNTSPNGHHITLEDQSASTIALIGTEAPFTRWVLCQYHGATWIATAFGPTYVPGTGEDLDIPSGDSITVSGGALIFSGNGHQSNRLVYGLDSAATVTIGSGGNIVGDIIALPVLTNNRVWTLTNGGARAGDEIKFFWDFTVGPINAHTVTIKNSRGGGDVLSVIDTEDNIVNHNGVRACVCVFNGFDWVLFSESRNGAAT